MDRRKKLSDDERKEIVQLNKDGLSYAALASRYNVSFSTIYRICRPDEYEKAIKQNRQYSRDNAEKQKKIEA